MRKKVIAGNWKMNMLPGDTVSFIEGLAPLVKDSENEVILCVPYTDLFYDQHSQSGSSHYLEWNTNVQKVVDYYVEDSGAIWLAIKVPEGYNTTSYDEYGNVVEPATNWWHKLEE